VRQCEDGLTVDPVPGPFAQQVAHIGGSAAAGAAAQGADHVDDGVGVHVHVHVGAAQLVGDGLRRELVQRGEIAHDAPLQPLVGRGFGGGGGVKEAEPPQHAQIARSGGRVVDRLEALPILPLKKVEGRACRSGRVEIGGVLFSTDAAAQHTVAQR
jgi:hypothetical protein